MKICKDGRIWGQNDKQAGGHLGTVAPEHSYIAKGTASESKKGTLNPFYGKHHSIETRESMSQSRMGSKNPFYGKSHLVNPFEGRTHTLEAKAKMSRDRTGSKHPNWKGGVGRLPYPFAFREALKESVRERDNYTCQICGIPQAECLRRLDIHHIDYHKENLDSTNLTSLCRGCNSKVNYNREYWYHLLRTSDNFTVVTIPKMKRGNYWLGRHHSEEAKAKMRGRHLSDEAKAKLRLAHLGTHHTDETKAKMSTQRKGERNSFYGKKHTPETRGKMSVAHTGKHYKRKEVQ